MSSGTDMLQTLFNLKGFKVKSLHREMKEATYSYGLKNAIVIDGEPDYNKSKVVCPDCGTTATKGNGTRPRKVQDIPLHGYDLTYLSYRTPDAKCKNPECPRASFTVPLPFIEKNGQKTIRFKNFLVNLAFKKFNFSQLSELYDVNPDELERWFLKRVEALDARRQSVHIPHLGIDEKTIDGKSYIVVLDTSTTPASVIDMAPGGKTANGFKKAVLKIKDHEKVETITIDMCTAYLSALNSLYPYRNTGHPETGEIIGPRVIIDRFHVSQYLMDAVSAARRMLWEERKASLRSIPDAFKRAKALEIWSELNKINHLWFYKNLNELPIGSKRKLLRFCEEYPEFAQLVAIKEDFRDIFDTSIDCEEAERRYAEWKGRVPIEKAAYHEFISFFNMVENHYREIFNYFMDPIGERYSNGPVEAKNSVISEVIQNMRGARFEVIRGKVLYGETRSADLKKVPAVRPKYLLDDDDSTSSYSMCLDMYLGGLREDYVVEAVHSIVEKCAAESHMEHNAGCTYEEALQHVRDTAFIDENIMNSISTNNNIQGRLADVAERMDTELLPPVVLQPMSQKEFLNRFLYFAAEANLADGNDLTGLLPAFFYDEDDEEDD